MYKISTQVFIRQNGHSRTLKEKLMIFLQQAMPDLLSLPCEKPPRPTPQISSYFEGLLPSLLQVLQSTVEWRSKYCLTCRGVPLLPNSGIGNPQQGWASSSFWLHLTIFWFRLLTLVISYQLTNYTKSR